VGDAIIVSKQARRSEAAGGRSAGPGTAAPFSWQKLSTVPAQAAPAAYGEAGERPRRNRHNDRTACACLATGVSYV